MPKNTPNGDTDVTMCPQLGPLCGGPLQTFDEPLIAAIAATLLVVSGMSAILHYLLRD